MAQLSVILSICRWRWVVGKTEHLAAASGPLNRQSGQVVSRAELRPHAFFPQRTSRIELNRPVHSPSLSHSALRPPLFSTMPTFAIEPLLARSSDTASAADDICLSSSLTAECGCDELGEGTRRINTPSRPCQYLNGRNQYLRVTEKHTSSTLLSL